MALGGAFAWTSLGRNAARAVGETWGAAGDAATIGLNGDAGSTTALPAGTTFATAGVANIATPGTSDFAFSSTVAGNATAAILADRVKVSLLFVTDPTAGVAASCGFQVAKSTTSPFRATLTVRGTPAVALEPEIYVEYLWSPAPGRS